jgi:hypothetical protein
VVGPPLKQEDGPVLVHTLSRSLMLVADDGGFARYITRQMMDRIRDDGAAPVFGCVQGEVLHGIRERTLSDG